MDPSSLVESVVREIALDGGDGVEESRLRDIVTRVLGRTPDNVLMSAIKSWTAGHVDITVENSRLRASEEFQWICLTGLIKSGNPVGNLAFELLSLIARSRERGVSTIEASKQTGQDLRSLFGRVQLLVNLGLVKKFPVIEHGSSTNRMVFHTYASSHSLGEAGLDKQAILQETSEFCKTGLQGIRTIRSIVHEIGSKMGIKENRKRPTVMNSVRELESLGCLRRITMVHPELEDKQYTCVEYLKAYESEPTTITRSGVAGPVVYPPSGQEVDDDGDADDEENDAEVAEDDEEDPYMVLDPKLSVLSSSDNLFDIDKGILANTTYALLNQIYDLVASTNSKGISAMDLTKRLTGVKYKKALGKFLDGLTTSTPGDSQITELEYLRLIKGVDFNKKVKFYRYFTALAYKKVNSEPERWGQFQFTTSREFPVSLAAVSSQLSKPLPGVCTVTKTPRSGLIPGFHGERTISGEVVLRSSPADSIHSSNNQVNGRRKRGRPRKNQADQSARVNFIAAPEVNQVFTGRERSWCGGVRASAGDFKKSRSLTAGLPSMPGERETNSNSTMKPSVPFGDVSKAPAISKVNVSDSVPSTTSSTSLPGSLGSLAMQSRLVTLMKIINKNNGAIQGGAPLLDEFNGEVSGEFTVDRRTVNGVVEKLVRDGTLQKIYVNVPTSSGKSVMKFILYDPSSIGDPDNNPVIERAKKNLVSGYKEKHAMATRAALNAARNATQSLPRREMSDQQMEALRPRSLKTASKRILSTRSDPSLLAPNQRTRYGPSAAEVLGVQPDGTLQSRVKRPARRSNAGTVLRVKREDQFTEFAGMENRTSSNDNTHIRSVPQNEPPRAEKQTKLPEIKDLDTLARSVIIYRSLFSVNNSTAVDWKVIASITPGVSTVADARRLWPDARSKLASYELGTHVTDVVLTKTKQFESLFLDAYRKGLIDYQEDQDPLTAIPRYTTWWREEEDRCSREGINEIAESSSSIRESKPTRVLRKLESLRLKDRYVDYVEVDPFGSLQSQVSIVNAEKLLLSIPFGVPLNMALASYPKLSNDEMRLRSVIAADPGPSYSAERAARELYGLSNTQTEVAKAGLESKRVIQWGENDPEKVPIGRPYVLSEIVEATLAVPKLDSNIPRKLSDGFAFFQNSGTHIEIPTTVDESDMICLTELSTFGLYGKFVRLQRIGEKFGLISSDYKSRGIDKHEFECDISGLVSDCHGNSPESFFSKFVEAPASGNSLRPWIWQTKYLSSKAIWFKVAYRILVMILFRPGITLRIIALNLRAALDYEETVGAVGALVDGGAIRKSSQSQGLFVVPNWFEYIVNDA